MGWLSTLTAFFNALNPMTAIFGAGLGALVTYFVNRFLRKKQAQDSAISGMIQDMNDHADDGDISVQDLKSAAAQISALESQALELDKIKPIEVTHGNGTP